jgi:hypothetical protein
MTTSANAREPHQTTKKEGIMPGIIDFITDIGGKPVLAGEFMKVISDAACTEQDLVDFFHNNEYPDVVKDDAKKLLDHRKNFKEDFGIPPQADY